MLPCTGLRIKLFGKENLAESELTSKNIADIEEPDYDGDWEEAVALINAAFRIWISDVILPVARMTPDDYSVKAVSA